MFTHALSVQKGYISMLGKKLILKLEVIISYIIESNINILRFKNFLKDLKLRVTYVEHYSWKQRSHIGLLRALK